MLERLNWKSQITNLLTLSKSDTSHLITEVETALVSLQVEQLHQQAIASGVWDFFPTPVPVTEQMLSLAQIIPGMKTLELSAGLWIKSRLDSSFL